MSKKKAWIIVLMQTVIFVLGIPPPGSSILDPGGVMGRSAQVGLTSASASAYHHPGSAHSGLGPGVGGPAVTLSDPLGGVSSLMLNPNSAAAAAAANAAAAAAHAAASNPLATRIQVSLIQSTKGFAILLWVKRPLSKKAFRSFLTTNFRASTGNS